MRGPASQKRGLASHKRGSRRAAALKRHGSALIGQSLVMASPGITGIRQVKKTWIRLVSKQVSRVYHDAFGGKEVPFNQTVRGAD
jgi:hypothetical protein